MGVYRPKNHIRFVTASSLFDGHDATINIIRRLLQAAGVEVVHLGHNRSVQELVDAAIQEDVQGIAVTSYQGGHMEYFKYLYDMLQERGYRHVRLFGGGGGVIVPAERKELEEYGIVKVFSPEDGRVMGLEGMVRFMVERADFSTLDPHVSQPDPSQHDFVHATGYVAREITRIEQKVTEGQFSLASPADRERRVPVIGLTGTGGAGKSSLTDELIRRFLYDFADKKFALLAVDPSKSKTGGALLGDRIRMNALQPTRVYMRSMATRSSQSEVSDALAGAVDGVSRCDFDLILVETSGIGQANARIADFADISVYVMTSDFGAPSQLEKIEMLDYADIVVINKFDRSGSEDALRDVRKQFRRSRLVPDEIAEEQLPVYGTVASRFNDEGTNALYQALLSQLEEKTGLSWNSRLNRSLRGEQRKPQSSVIIPSERRHYLSEIVKTVREEKRFVENQAKVASQLYQLNGARESLNASSQAVASSQQEGEVSSEVRAHSAAREQLDDLIEKHEVQLDESCRKLLRQWREVEERYRRDEFTTEGRHNTIKQSLVTYSLSGTRIPRISLPRYSDWGDLLRWLLTENLPGYYPFTAGVFPLKRSEEEPRRQFAGEGTPERTNRRFHYLCQDDAAKRLSTAFDSITLYGEDPDWRPDIYGKIGESGVSVCTLEDMGELFAGFDLCDPQTSVSMTINGPAPIILAMYLNTAIDQQAERFKREQGRAPSPEEYEQIRAKTLQIVRGTVQADILKEDQGQNTCIFSIDFAIKMMGDIQAYFVQNRVRHYYSISISGYHIAEAGANPISQLAFTLANGFTYVEYYLSRGMNIDDFAPNFSFFFSNGLDPEYSVIGRVARRIWARVIKNLYGGNERSQKLKYHIQTSGRSLHAQEMAFNDIRTTLQALLAIYDHCNSLHTNAYDEAITTPTEDSVRRAIAIQLIINREFGLTKNENVWQGSFVIEELTDLVEEAVLAEFMRLDDRGGVLGAMELQYQRGKIQDESMRYEKQKHTGELPIIGVNTFLHPRPEEEGMNPVAVIRATREEKEHQIQRSERFKQTHADDAARAIRRLQQVALTDGNLFAELMHTVRHASLGQITHALYEVGGEYRRNV